MLNILTNLRPTFADSTKYLINGVITWYAVIILSGALLGSLIGYFVFARRLHLDSDTLIVGLTIGLFVGILGARLYYVLFAFKDMEINSFIDIINPRNGGLAIHGAVIAAGIFIVIYCKLKKVKLLYVLEIAMPLILLAQVVGRWGNFVNQEAFGPLVPFTGEPVGGILSDAQLLEQREFLKHFLIPDFIIDRMYIASSGAAGFTIAGYYVPTFLMESVANLIGLTAYMIIRKYWKKIYVGDGLCFYLIWYGTVRLFIEILRTDALMIGNTGIKQNVLISAVFIVAGIALIVLRRIFKYKPISCYEALYGKESTMMEDDFVPPAPKIRKVKYQGSKKFQNKTAKPKED